MNEPTGVIGAPDKYYKPYQESSVDWANTPTAMSFEPDNVMYLVTRLGFTVYNASADFTQEIKMDFHNGTEWETRFLANNHASLANVASRVDTYKIGTIDVVSYMWHYQNGIKIYGTLDEKLKIYPSAAVINCDHFYCSLRYLEFVL